jgi:hypothetical protein
MLGLRETGKTTFLAALWLTLKDETSQGLRPFRLTALPSEIGYLQRITECYLKGEKMDRTGAPGDRPSELTIEFDNGDVRCLSIPDWSGETVREALDKRDWRSSIDEAVRAASGALLFVHPERVLPAQTISEVEEVVSGAISALAIQKVASTESPSSDSDERPRIPTDVQLVDLLQIVASRRGSRSPLRLAIVVSAWDLVSAMFSSGEAFVQHELPLLDQFLKWNPSLFQVSVFGVSAQGAPLERNEEHPSMDSFDRVAINISGKMHRDIALPLSSLL